MKMLLNKFVRFIVCFLFVPFLAIFVSFASPSKGAQSGSFKASIIEKAKLASVVIETAISSYAYSSGSGNGSASGFIVDKANGIICTNAHVVGGPCLAESYFVRFYSGKQVEAKLLYCDVWQDIAFLKIAPEEFPSNSCSLSFCKSAKRGHYVKEGERIFSISNTERAAFSFNDGYISSLYSTAGFMHQHAYVANFNQTSGSSGSAVLNTAGEVVAVTFGGAQSFKLLVDARYPNYLLKALAKGEIPVRKHIGAVLSFYDLSESVFHRDFPKDLYETYLKDHPEVRGKILQVDSIIKGSSAEGLLLPGDTIWRIEGKAEAADLFFFDHNLNCASEAVNLTVYRYGSGFIEVKVPTYDVNFYKIKKIVDFCDAKFVEADCFLARYRGVPLGTVFCNSIKESSPFVRASGGTRGAFSVIKINNKHIASLDDLISIAESLKKAEKSSGLVLNFVNHWLHNIFDSMYLSAHDSFQQDIKLKQDFILDVYDFDNKSLRWVRSIK